MSAYLRVISSDHFFQATQSMTEVKCVTLMSSANSASEITRTSGWLSARDRTSKGKFTQSAR
eukprot:CAMPEP_0118933074 /NCGR_PEP_ID=MMETSP1169-20130426/11215_1 /TAXON_ID=36882 /ORGANISM="Pyramimonas obovata, Strain CCMP722" /LENGTH=61 /DNA_ID=CAMNT_0006875797 /DNA_START=296 /DNA_END=481 /DNA_ORIENTATION=+